MRQDELMMNDWVEYGNIRAQVNSLTGNSDMIGICYTDSGNNICFKFVSTISLEPIPIDKDILIFNRFSPGMYNICDLGNGKYIEYYGHEHRVKVWWKGVDEWDNHSEVKDLIFQGNATYVHELQHVLQLCGIDKKIKL